MKCKSCKFEIDPALKHAIAQNICPACGKFIIDEETLTLIEDLESTISEEVALRKDTARKLATILVVKYEISPVVKRKTKPKPKTQEVMEVEETEIVNVSEIPNDIDKATRDKLFEEAVKERYNMMDQTTITAVEEEMVDEHADVANNILSGLGRDSVSDSELDGNPALEKDRLLRLAKQQQALNSGSGVFRRGG